MLHVRLLGGGWWPNLAGFPFKLVLAKWDKFGTVNPEVHSWNSLRKVSCDSSVPCKYSMSASCGTPPAKQAFRVSKSPTTSWGRS